MVTYEYRAGMYTGGREDMTSTPYFTIQEMKDLPKEERERVINHGKEGLKVQEQYTLVAEKI